ncbi:kinase-like domain-containing protein [Cantharellus anzutake]|uniref:kinase-like domain-containing protein n=1 Tax=Cantharellus anzutake TaxID=1750568 RepID=UPI001902F0DC|nr:kinase-like domain-containing protein [Cantharellus anzutake]KAF8326529.1 kinase-like domain-containing protein [Cantharellus anzutake]
MVLTQSQIPALFQSSQKLCPLVTMWSNAKHANILTAFGISPSDASPLFVVTEHLENGDISQYISRNPNADRTRLLLEVALGMQYLHENGIVHGGLKPSNILVNENGQSCVADCGLNMAAPSANPYSHHYYSPAAWKAIFTRPSDVYAFAMCAFDVLTSTRPWGNLEYDRIYQLVIEEDERPDRPEPDVDGNVLIPDNIWSLLTKAWAKEERARPDFASLASAWPVIDVADESCSHSNGVSARQIHEDPPLTSASGLRGVTSLHFSPTSTSSQGPRPMPPNENPSRTTARRHFSEGNITPHRPATSPRPSNPRRVVSERVAPTHNRSTSNAALQSFGQAISRTGQFYRRPNTANGTGLVPVSESMEPQPIEPQLTPYTTSRRNTAGGSSRGTSSRSAGSVDGGTPRSRSDSHPTSLAKGNSPLEIVEEFNAELNNNNGDSTRLNDLLIQMQGIATSSDKNAHMLATATVVDSLITLLRQRSSDQGDHTIVLITLGVLACVIL